MLFILALVGLYSTWRLSTGPGFRFSPSLLFFSLFFSMQVLGVMSMADESDRLDCLGRLGLALGILGFVLGLVTVSVWANYRPEIEVARIRERFALQDPYLGHKVVILMVGYVICCAIMVWFYRSSGGIPLLQGISALTRGDEILSAQILLKQRRLELTYFESSSYRGQGYVDQFRTVVLPYVVACFLVWTSVSDRKRWRPLVILSLLPVCLFLMGTGQRHPILSFVLTLSVLGYVMAPAGRGRSIVMATLGGGLVVFSILTFLLGRYGHTGSFRSDLPMVLLGLRNRIVYANSIGTMSLFHLFPNPEPFRWGWTWLSDLQGFLPGPHVGFSSWLYRRLYGAVGTAAPMCFGEMYANFGLAGVFFGAAALAMLMQLLQVHWTRRRRYEAEHIVLYCMLSIALSWWAVGGLLGPIQHGLVALPLLYGLVQMGRNLLVILRDCGGTMRRVDSWPLWAQRVKSGTAATED